MILKEDIKTILLITFIVVEILSMIFNQFFVKIYIGNYYFTFNYSVVFFCVGFFIVDIIHDFFSSVDAEKFFYYKVYSQILFLVLSKSAIYVYGIKNNQFVELVNESWWMIASGAIATYIGFKTMNRIMSRMKRGVYQGRSIFLRYIYSTLPGEIVFSFIFSILSFSHGREFNDVIHVFSSSCIAKIILSVIFAFIISVLFRVIKTDQTEKINIINRKNIVNNVGAGTQ